MTDIASLSACFSPRWHLTRVLVLLLCIAAASGLVSTRAQAEDVDYVVQPGDNPWSITERYLKGIKYWPRIQAYNHILEPRAIPPGTVLRIPLTWMRTQEMSARIVDLRGVVALDRGHEAVELKPGTTVHPGALLQTGADSSFTLALPDGTHCLVGANAELRLVSLVRIEGSGAQQVEIELLRGDIENWVQPNRRSGGRFLIRSPAAVAAVRGTEFHAAASAESTRIATLTGEVALGNRRGEVRLPAGVGSIARADQRPEAASPLLAAPDLTGLPGRVERLPIDLPIPALAGAVGYRSRIALPEGVAAIESDRTATRAAVLGRAELADGRYRFRVRAIDERGLEGLGAERYIVIDARPEPPFPLHPPPDGIASDERIGFSWAANPQALHYHFELAADRGFGSTILREEALREPAVEVDTALEPGSYFWRVAVTTADEGRGPYSDPQRFRRPAPGPVPEATVDGERLELRWRANEASVRYLVQFSTSADFIAPAFVFETAEAQLAIDQPPPGTYHVRIRGFEADGSASPWGRAQIVDVPYNHWRALLILVPLLLLL